MGLRTKYIDLIKNVGVFAISSFSVKAISFLVLPLYTYYLSTREYAVIDLVNTTAQLILPFLSLCIIDALLRFGISREYNQKAIFTNSVSLVVLGCLILPFIMLVIRRFINLEGVEVYFYIIYCLQVFNSLFASFCKAINKVKQMAIVSLVISASIIFFNVLFIAVLHWGIAGYFKSVIIGNVIGLVMYLPICRVKEQFRLRMLDRKLLKEMLCYSIPLIPNAVFWWINTSLDRYTLTALTSLSIVGLYSVANKIPTIITTVTSIFSQAWNLSAFQAFGDEESERFYNDTYVLYRNLLLVCTCIIILFSKVLAGMLFSKEFYHAWVFIPLLNAGVYYNSLNSFLGSLFTAGKKTKHIFYTTALGSIINIVLNIMLIKHFGPQGAAVATLISYLAVWLARAYSVNRIIRFHVNYVEEAGILIFMMLESIFMIRGGTVSWIIALASAAIMVFIAVRGIYSKYRLGLIKK